MVGMLVREACFEMLLHPTRGLFFLRARRMGLECLDPRLVGTSELRSSEVTSVLRVLLSGRVLATARLVQVNRSVYLLPPNRTRAAAGTARVPHAQRGPHAPLDSDLLSLSQTRHTNVSGDGVLTIVMSSVPARPAAPQLHAQPSADGPVHRGFGFPRSPTGGVPRPRHRPTSRVCGAARPWSIRHAAVSRVSRRLDRPCSD